MSLRRTATHTIQIAAPVDRCLHFFTPIGEELWVDGWKPHYIVPANGRTEPGMVFTTGSGDEFTLWTLVDFDERAHRARYVRVTPASRSAIVDVRCTGSANGASTAVQVTYTVTALAPHHVPTLAPYEDAAFVAMIEGWRSAIEAKLPQLLAQQPPPVYRSRCADHMRT